MYERANLGWCTHVANETDPRGWNQQILQELKLWVQHEQAKRLRILIQSEVPHRKNVEVWSIRT